MKITSLEHVINTFSELEKQAKTPATSQMLTHINKACEAITRSGAIVTISTVVKILNELDIDISTRTLYNKRNGKNLYRTLIDSWIEHSSHVNTVNLQQDDFAKTPTSPLIDDELPDIADIPLRKRVALMIGEIKGLRNQVNTLKELRTLPLLNNPVTNESMTSENDVKLLQELLNINQMGNVGFNDSGQLTTLQSLENDQPLTSKGVKQVIEKIINNYLNNNTPNKS